uniref:Golgin-45 n=1 Tax=Ascaris lumbricoides TaxID=6252 RepID=A0A9J2PCB8_ASCLU
MRTSDEKSAEQMKKKGSSSKLVLWEPYKAATSANVKGSAPTVLPQLIPYQLSSSHGSTDASMCPLVNGTSHIATSSGTEDVGVRCERIGMSMSQASANRKDSSQNGINPPVQVSPTSCDEELRRVKAELETEKQVSAELKRLLVASMGDDLMWHVKSLSEDKVRLASTMNSFAAQLNFDHDRAENLAISSDVWRCKFLAMSIRADELLSQRERLFALLKEHHSALNDLYDAIRMPRSSSFWQESIPGTRNAVPETRIEIGKEVLAKVQKALSTDMSSLCERTPCDEKVVKAPPVTSNITVSCCKHCAGREIKLL